MRVTAAHRLDGVHGQNVVASDRTNWEGAQPAVHALVDQPVLGLHQLGRGRLHQRSGGVLIARAQQVREACCELGGNIFRPHQTRRRALRNRPGEQPFGVGHRQQRGGDARARALAKDGDIARVAAELRDVVTHPLQSQHQIAQIQVAVDGHIPRRQRRQVQTSQRTQPVVHRYVHAAAAGQRGTVVEWGGRAAQEVPAAVDENHDRQRFGGCGFRCDDVEGEAVLAHGLVAADAEQGVTTQLRRAVGEPMAVPHTRPGLGRLGRPEPQRSQRRARVRDGSPAVDPVAGETLDDAAGDAGAHGALVHNPTVTDMARITRA